MRDETGTWSKPTLKVLQPNLRNGTPFFSRWYTLVLATSDMVTFGLPKGPPFAGEGSSLCSVKSKEWKWRQNWRQVYNLGGSSKEKGVRLDSRGGIGLLDLDINPLRQGSMHAQSL